MQSGVGSLFRDTIIYPPPEPLKTPDRWTSSEYPKIAPQIIYLPKGEVRLRVAGFSSGDERPTQPKRTTPEVTDPKTVIATDKDECTDDLESRS